MSKNNSTKGVVKLSKSAKIMAAMAGVYGHPGGVKATLRGFTSAEGVSEEYKRTGYKGAWWRKGEAA